MDMWECYCTTPSISPMTPWQLLKLDRICLNRLHMHAHDKDWQFDSLAWTMHAWTDIHDYNDSLCSTNGAIWKSVNSTSALYTILAVSLPWPFFFHLWIMMCAWTKLTIHHMHWFLGLGLCTMSGFKPCMSICIAWSQHWYNHKWRGEGVGGPNTIA